MNESVSSYDNGKYFECNMKIGEHLTSWKKRTGWARRGGWYLLGLVSPIGLTIVIPKIAGTTIGTGKENPCVEAMSVKMFAVQEVSELQEGFWDWMGRKIKGVFRRDDESKNPPPNSESGEP